MVCIVVRDFREKLVSGNVSQRKPKEQSEKEGKLQSPLLITKQNRNELYEKANALEKDNLNLVFAETN